MFKGGEEKLKYSGLLKSPSLIIIANNRCSFGSSDVITQNKEEQNSRSLKFLTTTIVTVSECFRVTTHHIHVCAETYLHVCTYIARIGLMCSLVLVRRTWDATGYTRGRNV